MKRNRILRLGTLIFLGFSQILSAQDLNIPAPSPGQTIHQDFALSYIALSYSRPGVKGRQIFGDLVPYGQVWRTGANASTKISFGEPVSVAGHRVEMGKYALYTIPGKETWTVILSRDTTLDGALGYKPENDLLRFEVRPYHLTQFVESFTMDIADIQPDSAYVTVAWANTGIRFLVTADIDKQISSQIDRVMAGQGAHKPYYGAATYYFNTHRDLNKALDWVNEAIKQNNQAYYMVYLKAEILAGLGRKTEAIATARLSGDLASKAGNPDYVRLNSKLIASLNSGTH